MSEAAQKLGITQPALSESIKRFESDLRNILFYRTRTGISLTPFGRQILAQAKTAWSALNDISLVDKRDGNFGPRHIIIGCHPLVASYCLPAALRILQGNAPDYKVTLKHDLSRSIQMEVQRGRIDLGIVINPSPSPDLVIKKIGEDDFGVWTGGGPCPDKVFCNLDLVQTQSILRRWKTRPKDIIDSNSLELIVRLTSQKLGFGILPARAVHLLDAGLERVPSTPSFKDVISILYRPEFGRSRVDRTVIEALTQAIATT